MALPTNEHHVHSDGYFSDKGSVDEQRRMIEVADDIGGMPGVFDARADHDVDGPYVEAEHDGDQQDDIGRCAETWGCEIVRSGEDWVEIRPE